MWIICENVRVKESKRNCYSWMMCVLWWLREIKSVFKHLLAMITPLIQQRTQYKYKICTQHRNLEASYGSNQLNFHKHYTAAIVRRNLESEGFKNGLTIEEAYNEYNHCTICKCNGECATNSWCSCKATGFYCISLYHKVRGKNKKCTLNADLKSSEEDYDSDD